MNAVSEIVAELRARGVRIECRKHGGIRLAPASSIDSSLLDRIHAHKSALLAHLHGQQEDTDIDRLARCDGWERLPPAGTPAYSIVETCQHYGVALRIDDAGDLVVGKAGAKAEAPTQPWRSLVMALEAHVDEVAELIGAGWTLNAAFPDPSAA